MNSLRLFLSRVYESIAYHEAGHTVAAFLQHLPLHDGGIHIDMEGSGVTYYCHRLPGDPDNSETSRIEREKTIIALYAGRIAQNKFYPAFDDSESWKPDWAVVAQLLNELAPTAPGLTGNALYIRAERLVLEHWSTVESLASIVWSKPVTPMSSDEFEKGWSRGTKRQEKVMPRSEIQAFFTKLQIPSAQ